MDLNMTDDARGFWNEFGLIIVDNDGNDESIRKALHRLPYDATL